MFLKDSLLFKTFPLGFSQFLKQSFPVKQLNKYLKTQGDVMRISFPHVRDLTEIALPLKQIVFLKENSKFVG